MNDRRISSAGSAALFEMLETRRLLSGDVTATLKNGILALKGDNAGNLIEIGLNTSGNIVVSTSRDNTTINHRNTFVASQVNSIEMSLGNGNDSALIGSVGESLNLFGDLVIKDNHGDDHYELYDNVHANRINIETGAGSDTVLVYFSSANSIVVDAGADDDNVDFLLDSARSLNIVAGQGDDAVSIRNLTVNSLMVDTGSGDDEMVMSADTISTAMLIKLGDGLDSIRASSITGPGNGVVDGGIDTDIYDRTFGGNSGYSIIAFESVVF